MIVDNSLTCPERSNLLLSLSPGLSWLSDWHKFDRQYLRPRSPVSHLFQEEHRLQEAYLHRRLMCAKFLLAHLDAMPVSLRRRVALQYLPVEADSAL